MTNAELITALQQLPPNDEAKVYFVHGDVTIPIDRLSYGSLVSNRYPVIIRKRNGVFHAVDYASDYFMVDRSFDTEQEAIDWAEAAGHFISDISEEEL